MVDPEDHYTDLRDAFYRAAADLERDFAGFEPLAAAVVKQQHDYETQNFANSRRLTVQLRQSKAIASGTVEPTSGKN